MPPYCLESVGYKKVGRSKSGRERGAGLGVKVCTGVGPINEQIKTFNSDTEGSSARRGRKVVK